MIGYHQPVLLAETLTLLSPKPGEIFLDATLGHAGHTIPLLQAGATVYGLDADPQQLRLAANRIASLELTSNFFPINSNFCRLSSVFHHHINQPLSGIIFDLGLNSLQQTQEGRGFSFNDHQSLDMRLSRRQKTTAADIVNRFSADKLFFLFSSLSQEPFSREISDLIVSTRHQSPITTATQLSSLVRHFYSQKKVRTPLDPATKIFLALRLAVNNDLQNLSQALADTIEISCSSTKICVITFHSTEDRLVKQFIRREILHQTISPLSPPLKPSPAEISHNPLSRSAILRSYRINS